MRKVSVTDLHTRTAELVREAAEGTVIVVEDEHGESLAELRPLETAPDGGSLPLLEDLWNSMPQVSTDSGRILEEHR